MDDVVCGAPTTEKAYIVYSKKLLKLAGFNLRKFASDLNRRVAQDESMD